MKIPSNTVSASQLRVYGSGGFQMDDEEAEQGCPRKYKARYVDGIKEEGPKSYALEYGTFFHNILFLMESGRDLTPDEALAEAYEPDMPYEMWTEAQEDLARYLARETSPSDRYGIIAVETELSAILYADEVYGPITFRGFLDVLGIDVNVEGVLHFTDYKTNRAPGRASDLKGDRQLLGYTWLILQNYRKWMDRKPIIITHKDLVKFKDLEVKYTTAEIDEWHSWAVAVVRKILRDETAEPILNPGCGYCFVKDSCPAFNALPTLAQELAKEGSLLKDPVQRLKWRDDANKMKNLLDKGVKSIDEEFKSQAAASGLLVVGSQQFSKEENWSYVVDLKRLHELLGDEEFYKAVSISKAAVERAVKGKEPSDADRILNETVSKELDGWTIKRGARGSF